MAHTNEAAIDLDWHSLSDEEIRYFDDTWLSHRAERAWTRILLKN